MMRERAVPLARDTLLAVAVAAALVWLTPLGGLDKAWWDILAPSGAPVSRERSPILLVDTGGPSVSRALLARAVDQLKAGGAKVIALDYLLDLPKTPEEDLALVEAVRRAGNVVLPAEFYRSPAGAWSLFEPTTDFASGAAAVGFANLAAETDNTIRRVPLFRYHAVSGAPERRYLAFPLEIVRVWLGLPSDQVAAVRGGPRVEIPGLAPVPVDALGRMAMDFRRGADPDRSAGDPPPFALAALTGPDGDLNPALGFLAQDRIVLVGHVDTARNRDLFVVPGSGGRAVAGVRVVGQAVWNLLAGAALGPVGPVWTLLLAAILALAVGLAPYAWKGWLPVVVGAACAIACPLVGLVLFQAGHVLLLPAVPLVAVAGAWLLGERRAVKARGRHLDRVLADLTAARRPAQGNTDRADQLEQLPYPIACVAASVESQTDASQRLDRSLDLLTVTLQYLSAVELADLLRRDSAKLGRLPQAAHLARPSLGHWHGLLREAMSELGSAEQHFVPPLAALWGEKRFPARIDQLVQVRNAAKHGPRPSDQEVLRLSDVLERAMDELLGRLAFLADYPLVVLVAHGTADSGTGSRSGRITYKLHRLVGPSPHFKAQEGVLAAGLYPGRPYLLDPRGQNHLALFPWVARMDCEHHHLPEFAFFSGLHGKGVSYYGYEHGCPAEWYRPSEEVVRFFQELCKG